MPPRIITRCAIVSNALSAASYCFLSATASRIHCSISGSRLSASSNVKRLGIWVSDAGNLNRHGTAAWAVEFGQDDALPGAEQHGGIAHLQAKALPHHHSP